MNKDHVPPLSRDGKLPIKLPPPLSVDLDNSVGRIAEYLAGKNGVPKETVLLGMSAVLVSLISCHARVRWQCENPMPPAIQILVVGGLIPEHESWINFLTKPLPALIARQAVPPTEVTARNLELEDYTRGYLQSPADSPIRGMQRDKAVQLWDSVRAARFCPSVPMRKHFSYEFSPLVASADMGVVRQLSQDVSERSWMGVLFGASTELGPASPLTMLCVAGPEDVGRFTQSRLGRQAFPLVLPQSGGAVKACLTDETRVEQEWQDLTARFSEWWSKRGRATLAVSPHGENTISALLGVAEELCPASRYPARYAWIVNTCLAVASQDHFLRYGGTIIDDRAWDYSRHLVEWAIRAHTACLGRFVSPKVYPPKAEDMERLRNRLRLNPNAKYRELVRALPKRHPGYWRHLHKLLANSPTPLIHKIISNTQFGGLVNPTNPTHPTPPTDPTYDIDKNAFW